MNSEITLPASKSISNRALIMSALSKNAGQIFNLSDSDDTRVLLAALRSADSVIDIGAAGTAMRFLTAYFAVTEGKRILTGSERMKQRPIKILVDALQTLGADIQYLENEGFPPLKICGTQLSGSEILLNGSVSSQYISALMMIAPTMPNGLKINLEGKIISAPYIKMTAKMLGTFGVKVEENLFSENSGFIKIAHQHYQPADFRIEADWSAASYWYELLAIAGKGKIVLRGLYKNSLQGDSAVAHIFENLGVTTKFYNDKIEILPNGNYVKHFEYDFTEQPDLAQTLVVTCCMCGVSFCFSGLQSLKIKETNRVAALITELAKLGFALCEHTEGELAWDGARCDVAENISIKTYSDHRMAMAFAPAALKFPLTIENPEVVSKSYTRFWEDLTDVASTSLSHPETLSIQGH
ncbi:MAG: 3-phosphoshikimate 1-carboxyvinyltransferase [Paludibacter sp.]|nr:3-phosphoshikimate 1-carboxyvinyltransferase [Paludibacter sp.]